ncbi:uncharacterized protein LOC142181004 [Nicotiana tabacum]|uniref:Uncharacterized protein LOC142181004 n=1 Tax=Nicotiana tabacum TaxID=4097 RepID=A0AC58UIA2_TOBAC
MIVESDGVLRIGDRLCVADVDGLRQAILEEAHNSRYTIHLGSTKMYHDLKQFYWWEGMKKNVANFVSNCLTCQQVKAEHQSPTGLLQQVEIPEWKWKRITMNFVTRLPQTLRGYNSIWVIVDRLIKISTLFASKDYTWRSEMGRQSERTIQILEDMLRACILEFRDKRRRGLVFIIGDKVFLRVSSMKGVMRFGKRGKLRPKFVGPYEILDRVRVVAYRLALPPEFSFIHPVFHVSMLRKCISNSSHMLEAPTIPLDEKLSYEEELISFVDRQVRKLRSKEIVFLKVLWRNNTVEEPTWEVEDVMRVKYPHLFQSTVLSIPTDRKRTRRFVDGLTFQLRLLIPRERVFGATFKEVVDIAREIGSIHRQERVEREANRPCGSGSFGGVPSGGKFHHDRGCPYRHAQTTQPVHRGELLSHSSHINRSCQYSFSALPAQSSHHASSAQVFAGSSSGYQEEQFH